MNLRWRGEGHPPQEQVITKGGLQLSGSASPAQARLRSEPELKSPRSRACWYAAKCAAYIPSRRSTTPTVPGAHRSASRKSCSFSSVLNLRRCGFSGTSRSLDLEAFAWSFAVTRLGLQLVPSFPRPAYAPW
jgi:hypothetical protein